MSEVEQLRQQLRDRGYLTNGLERWFALDPWSSRTFWAELGTVSLKAAILVALFGTFPVMAIMLVRNHPMTATEVLLMMAAYGATWLAGSFAFLLAVALILKLRPELAVDGPRALLAVSMAAAAILAVPIALWWSRFEAPPRPAEIAAGVALIVVFFVVTTLVTSAALLSFSVYELQRVPAIHQRPRTVPLSIAGAAAIALLLIPAYAAQEKAAPEPPPQVVVTPTIRRAALVGVDGLTYEIFRSRAALTSTFSSVSEVAGAPGESATERWATVGTGVPTAAHGVRAIEGVRLAGGTHVFQSISRADFVLHDVVERAGLGRRQPLPPTVRRRDYVWEIFAARGVPSLAVDWWTTPSVRAGALESVGQEAIFAAAQGDPVRVDLAASRRLAGSMAATPPQFATVYLPALDVVLNRLDLDASARLAASVRALDNLDATVALLRRRGYDVILAGLPGEHQSGHGVVASTVRIANAQSVFDVTPTLCDLEGFPLSAEMPGRSLLRAGAPRIASYGTRAASPVSGRVDQEYYDNLKSLGYIR